MTAPPTRPARRPVRGTAPVRDGRWDRLGRRLSGLCAVHCLAGPLLAAAVPLLPVAAALHAWLHPVLAGLIVPTTAAAAHDGYRRHRSRLVVALFVLGVGLVLAALTVHELADTETGLTLVGSILLLAAHRFNGHGWLAEEGG